MNPMLDESILCSEVFEHSRKIYWRSSTAGTTNKKKGVRKFLIYRLHTNVFGTTTTSVYPIQMFTIACLILEDVI